MKENKWYKGIQIFGADDGGTPPEPIEPPATPSTPEPLAPIAQTGGDKINLTQEQLSKLISDAVKDAVESIKPKENIPEPKAPVKKDKDNKSEMDEILSDLRFEKEQKLKDRRKEISDKYGIDEEILNSAKSLAELHAIEKTSISVYEKAKKDVMTPESVKQFIAGNTSIIAGLQSPLEASKIKEKQNHESTTEKFRNLFGAKR